MHKQIEIKITNNLKIFSMLKYPPSLDIIVSSSVDDQHYDDSFNANYT